MIWETEGLEAVWGDWPPAAITSAAMLMNKVAARGMVTGSILMPQEGDNHSQTRGGHHFMNRWDWYRWDWYRGDWYCGDSYRGDGRCEKRGENALNTGLSGIGLGHLRVPAS